MSATLVSPAPSVPPPAVPAPAMKFTVHRDVLLAELSVAYGITSSGKTVVPILTNLLLEARGGYILLSPTRKLASDGLSF